MSTGFGLRFPPGGSALGDCRGCLGDCGAAACRNTKSFLPFGRPLRSNYLITTPVLQCQHSSEDARKDRYRYLTLRHFLPNHLPANFKRNLEDGARPDRQKQYR